MLDDWRHDLFVQMAEYVWQRTATFRSRAGESEWSELLNYEVGALSEVFSAIAMLTHDASWLEAAALFDRRCFTAPLALAGVLHEQRRKIEVEHLPSAPEICQPWERGAHDL